MNASPDARNMAARAVQNFATQLRESAQANIVSSFRASLEGGGQGPTDNELRIFARLAAYEHRVRSQRPEGAPSPSHAIRPEPEFAESESLAAPSPVAFGDLVDLARYRNGHDGEVCAACRTINPLASKFCKGCAGRLPAFYATIAPPSPTPQPQAMAPRAPQPAGAGRPPLMRSPRVLVSTTVLASALLLALAAALAPWSGGSNTANSALHIRPVMSSLDAPPPALAAQTTPRMAAIEQLPPIELPSAAVATRQAVQAVQASANEDEDDSDSAAAAPLRKPQRKLAATPTRNVSREIDRPAGASRSVASCGDLNFFARAVCMNNVCAQPGMNRKGQCVDAVRQRRLDEARRNPTLLG